jgi:hypothetical protein
MSEIIDRVASNYGVSRADYLGACAGQILALGLYRKLGAPWWAAWGFSVIQSNLFLINKREAARV